MEAKQVVFKVINWRLLCTMMNVIVNKQCVFKLTVEHKIANIKKTN